MRLDRIALPLLLIALAGCSTTRLTDPTPPAPTPAPTVARAPVAAVQPAATPAAPTPTPQSAVRSVTIHPLDDPKSQLLARSVYFEFDSAALRDADHAVIESHARYLASSRTAKVRIEGHADERGGHEYNLALGQKRAQAALKALQLMGAPAAELEATSFGKERPRDPGHDEAAWAKNRRADLNYLAR